MGKIYQHEIFFQSRRMCNFRLMLSESDLAGFIELLFERRTKDENVLLCARQHYRDERYGKRSGREWKQAKTHCNRWQNNLADFVGKYDKYVIMMFSWSNTHIIYIRGISWMYARIVFIWTPFRSFANVMNLFYSNAVSTFAISILRSLLAKKYECTLR